MKKISLILLINGIFALFCIGQQADTTIYRFPEIQPTFKYDTCTSLRSSVKEYFLDSYKMPAAMLGNGYVGMVVIEFVIEKDSSMSNIKLFIGIDEPLNKSVIESITAMPKWVPGKNKGKNVRTKIIVGVRIEWLYGRYEDE